MAKWILKYQLSSWSKMWKASGYLSERWLWKTSLQAELFKVASWPRVIGSRERDGKEKEVACVGVSALWGNFWGHTGVNCEWWVSAGAFRTALKG